MRWVLSPLSLLLICWGLSGAGVALTLAYLDRLDLVQTFMRREDLSLSAFTTTGAAWLFLALLAYAVGDLAARFSYRSPQRNNVQINLTRAAYLTFALNLVLLGVTALWIATAAAQAGGLMHLAAAAYIDSLTTRDLLLENKLFTGMRLFYAALPGTACLATALLCLGPLPRHIRGLLLSTLIGNTLALFILPIVMSQRLLLLQLLLSCYLVACLIRGRLVGWGWSLLAMALFLGLWMAREAITNPMFDRSTFDIGTQKLAFYLINDMWNSFAPLAVEIPHTWGGLSLEGVMFLTVTDGYFAHILAPRLDVLQEVLGGGEFPLLTAAYVDFGPVLGAFILAFVGFVIRGLFIKARHSLGFALAYAQIGATLLFSSHSVYLTHQNLLFSLILISALLKLVTQHHAPRPHPSPLLFRSCRKPLPQCLPLPVSLIRQITLFTSQRTQTNAKRPRHERA